MKIPHFCWLPWKRSPPVKSYECVGFTYRVPSGYYISVEGPSNADPRGWKISGSRTIYQTDSDAKIAARRSLVKQLRRQAKLIASDLQELIRVADALDKS